MVGFFLRDLKKIKKVIYLCKTSVQCHCRMICILSQIQVRCTPQLLLDDQSLLKELETAGQELIFDFQKVALAHIHFEGFVDDGEPVVVLDVLPTAVTMGHNSLRENNVKKLIFFKSHDQVPASNQ